MGHLTSNFKGLRYLYVPSFHIIMFLAIFPIPNNPVKHLRQLNAPPKARAHYVGSDVSWAVIQDTSHDIQLGHVLFRLGATDAAVRLMFPPYNPWAQWLKSRHKASETLMWFLRMSPLFRIVSEVWEWTMTHGDDVLPTQTSLASFPYSKLSLQVVKMRRSPPGLEGWASRSVSKMNGRL